MKSSQIINKLSHKNLEAQGESLKIKINKNLTSSASRSLQAIFIQIFRLHAADFSRHCKQQIEQNFLIGINYMSKSTCLLFISYEIKNKRNKKIGNFISQDILFQCQYLVSNLELTENKIAIWKKKVLLQSFCPADIKASKYQRFLVC